MREKLRSINKILIVVMVMMGSLLASAQERKAKLYVKPHNGDSVQLRWIITDPVLWQECKKTGVDIYRGNKRTGETVKINDAPVKALSPDDWTLRFAEKENGEYVLNHDLPDQDKIAMGCYYPVETEFNFDLPKDRETIDWGDDKQSIMCLFFNLACLKSLSAARHAGTVFTDKKTVAQTIYTYYLVEGGKQQATFLDTVTVNSSASINTAKPRILRDNSSNRIAQVFYTRIDTSYVVFPFYTLLRSDKINGIYKTVLREPHFALFDPYLLKDTVPVFLTDSTLERNNTYFYKVKGYDMFGDSSQLSDAYSIKEFTPLGTAPFITKAKNVGLKYNEIAWTFDSTKLENLVSFSIMRSNDPIKGYKVIAKDLKADVRTFQDKQYPDLSFYRVMALGRAGDTVLSGPESVYIRDSIAPQKPKIVSAVCDSNGVIRLSWNHGGEKDLKGFLIFRANFPNEEYSRIANIIRDSIGQPVSKMDTVLFDTISLRTSDPYIYYKMSAFDYNYNPSGFSEVFRAVRVDTLKPNSPVFTKADNPKGQIKLSWACSSSPDVDYSILYRRLRGETAWKEYYRYRKCDTAGFHSYADTIITRRVWYEYALQAVDVHKLRSAMSQTLEVQALDDGLRAPIEDFKADLNKQHHTVKLTWKYRVSGVEKYMVYRSKNQKQFEFYAISEQQKNEFYDSETAPGNTYSYKIKAKYIDGGQSPLTEEIKVQY